MSSQGSELALLAPILRLGRGFCALSFFALLVVVTGCQPPAVTLWAWNLQSVDFKNITVRLGDQTFFEARLPAGGSAGYGDVLTPTPGAAEVVWLREDGGRGKSSFMADYPANFKGHLHFVVEADGSVKFYALSESDHSSLMWELMTKARAVREALPPEPEPQEQEPPTVDLSYLRDSPEKAPEEKQ
ncbi:MAG: hypothetical protein WBH85_10600 [Thermoanaerobaculia bacterium]